LTWTPLSALSTLLYPTIPNGTPLSELLEMLESEDFTVHRV
jgi:hypothetical protein